MTLAVIGLDALDYALAQKWDCSNLLLESHSEIETFSHTFDYPITAEVWPTIATGKLPSDDGGESGGRDEDWSGAMGMVNRVANSVLPMKLRVTVGKYLRKSKEVPSHFDPTDEDHLFGKGVVYNWPSLTPAQNWSRSENWLREFYDGNLTDEEFFRRQLAFTGEEVGWLQSMSHSNLPIVGTRCHILDHTGHAWADHPEKLKRAYMAVDSLIENIRNLDTIDQMLIVSDHGMKSSILPADETSGEHSWRATIAYSEDNVTLPSHVKDIRDWVETRDLLKSTAESWDETTTDTPTEHLRDLGYL